MSAKEMKSKARAFVLISATPQKERDVMEELLKFSRVKEVHLYPGKMDLIAMLEVPHEVDGSTSQKIADFVIEKIQSISGILDTETITPTHSKTKWSESV